MKKHLLKIASLIFVLALVLATFAACSASGGAGGVVDALNVECKEGAKVKNCILMQGTVVGDNAELNYLITDKNVSICENHILTSSPQYPMYVGKGASV